TFLIFVFFFQAEDCIRDRNVTGVRRVLFRSKCVKGGLFMAHFFVSEEDVIQSIDYFKSINLDREGMLPIFLISKYLGVSLRRPITFTSLDTDQKSEILKVIWQLGEQKGKKEQ